MLTTIIRLIVKTFFREVVIEGRENLPVARPAIFTPNHPNALLDPMLLFFFSSPSQLRFVAKAPLFRIPVLGWILRWLRAIPVVRHLDVEGEIDYTAFFAACVNALAAGDSTVIFPEGRSLPQPSMAPLRTGAARLYFLARERGIDPKIVPLGLNYERGEIFRTSVLPYKLIAALVRLTRRDESVAATYKILFSLFLFPLMYVVEGILIARWFGTVAAVAFAVLIVPLSYFTLLFFEWREELGARPPLPLAWLRRRKASRVLKQLSRLRQRIVTEIDGLSSTLSIAGTAMDKVERW
ncbi:MAG: 1-acyl-sn-glycerol-3-phosphate acyltransferase [Acidobacteria bacterium]|nr:1-acyl-sn-glycerol-3-phosphate acyltransferase [Acidobacteriota bacterium]